MEPAIGHREGRLGYHAWKRYTEFGSCERLRRRARQPYLGLVRKLPNRPLIEYNFGLQPSSHTICCGGDRCRTHPRAIFHGGAVSRRTRPSSGRGGGGICCGVWWHCRGGDGNRHGAKHDRARSEGIGAGGTLGAGPAAGGRDASRRFSRACPRESGGPDIAPGSRGVGRTDNAGGSGIAVAVDLQERTDLAEALHSRATR
jgi:hypothetical protein